VKSTQQITRAMKFVAAAKLRRAQEGVYAARPYAREIVRVLRSAAERMETPAHPLLERRREEKLLVVVLTGDRSLCGAFNSNVIRHATEFLHAHSRQKAELMVVGRKGRDTLRRRGFKFVAEYLNVSASVDYGKAKEISARIAALYTTQEVDAVYAVYNEFKNVMVQRLRAEKILPLDSAIIASGATAKEEQQIAEHAGPGGSLPMKPAPHGTGLLVDYIAEQPITEIFGGLVPRYLDAEVFRILLESAAAEHAARMTAMDSATRNARELIDKLTLQMNKIRQAAITKELIEVVSGAGVAAS